MWHLMPQAPPAAVSISCLSSNSFPFPSNETPLYTNQVGEEREGNLALKTVPSREAMENTVYKISQEGGQLKPAPCLPASSAFSTHQFIPITTQEIAASLKYITFQNLVC